MFDSCNLKKYLSDRCRMWKLRARNIICDYSLCPLNEFNELKYGREKAGETLRLYPTLRIFCILDSGKKCCAHLHGFLPYFLLRIRTRLSAGLYTYISDLILEVALQNFEELGLNGAQIEVKDVLFGIFEETGRSIYGYQKERDYFIRLTFFDPKCAKLCAAFMQKEAERIEFLQPFNAHIPFILQFFVDFSLHGMDFVYFANAYYRNGGDQFHMEIRTSPLRPCSNCAIEFDAYVDDLVNPWMPNEGNFESVGLNHIWAEERERSRLLGHTSFSEMAESVEREEDDKNGEEWKGEFAKILEELENIQRGQTLDPNCSQIMESPSSLGLQRTSGYSPCRSAASSQMISEMSELGDEEEDEQFYPCSSQRIASQRIWENYEYRSRGYDVEEEEYAFTEEGFDIAIEGQHGEEYGKVGEEEDKENNRDNTPLVEMGSSDDESAETTIVFDDDEDESVRIDMQLVGGEESQHERMIYLCYDDNACVSITNCPAAYNAREHESSQPACQIVVPVNSPLPFSSIASTPRTPLSMDSNYKTTRNRNNEKLLAMLQSGVDHLCALSIEVIALPAPQSRRAIAEPVLDPVLGVTFAYHRDICNWQPSSHSDCDTDHDEDDEVLPRTGCILLEEYSESDPSLLQRISKSTLKLSIVKNEKQLFSQLTRLVLKLDPEFLIGYDTKRLSWGYLFGRSQALEIPFQMHISRIKHSFGNPSPFRHPVGRVILEVWWNVRREKPLRDYRFATVVKELLEIKFPALDCTNLSQVFFESNVPGARATVLRLVLRKALLNLHLLSSLDLFLRTSQMARVYGIQFEGVLTRGSQFRVESMLLRIARRRHLFAPSVSAEQREKMDSPETIALTMEPASGLYRDPVVVLDFQSLYPSVCIAHNYCFSTCLGKLANIRRFILQHRQQRQTETNTPLVLGALHYGLPPAHQLKQLLRTNKIVISPSGAIFVTEQSSILSILLRELLDTRVMVKAAMKRHKGNPKLVRILNARQMALKLIANVTYGYTAANWSGRMPCEEVADAIVSKGREALERAIRLIDGAPLDAYRGARVIYGDTDSLFVLCKDCTREEAFDIGSQIVNAVTAQNPHPIRLKLEKVFQPCLLETKKRYVGMSYENPSQSEGQFDAKGVETVRRDSPLFVAKMVERFLHLIFTDSLELALHYLEMRLQRVQRIELDEFVLSADYVGHYGHDSHSPIHKIATQLASRSSRLAPVYGERICFLVGSPQQHHTPNNPPTLLSCSLSVDDFLRNPGLSLNFNYYIRQKLFPALQRVLMHIPMRLQWANFDPSGCCANCFQKTNKLLCDICIQEEGLKMYRRTLIARHSAQNIVQQLRTVCRTCIVGPVKSINAEYALPCYNFHCPVKRRIVRELSDPMANAHFEFNRSL